MEIFSYVRGFWGAWELRAMVLTSLFIQILLIFMASIRKYTTSRKIGFLIWSCYLLADWVSTLALGVLVKSLLVNDYYDQSGNEIKKFWAPFLLLHLGGPDNITAFSMEDNELWLRHFLGLLFQAGTAFCVLFSSWHEVRLHVVTILMFIGGTIKYVERALALMKASRNHFTDFDPGLDYAEFMVEYSSQRNAARQISLTPEIDAEMEEILFWEATGVEKISEIELMMMAHHLFQIFRCLVADLFLTFNDFVHSASLLSRINWVKVYKVIEIELEFLYEVLYTKAAVVRTLKGLIFRFISFSSIIAASIIFFVFNGKEQYHTFDIMTTYVLLGGAIALEFWSLMTQLLFTDWVVVWMKKKNWNPQLTRFVFKILSYGRPHNQSRWSNSMAQYNLIQFCVKDQRSFRGKVMKGIHVKDLFDNHWHRTYKNISDELKEFIFKDLMSKLQLLASENDPNFAIFQNMQYLRSCRGQLAIKKINTDEVLDNSIKAEFDESILLWHIATDICYYLDGDEETVQSYRRISRDISNYMLYLLVSRPFMLTAGIGQIRYADTCADAKRFFHQRETEANDEEQACKSLHKVDTEVPSTKVKGNRNKSVLFEAIRVAKSLLKQEIDIEKRWEVISNVWLEILCYAAGQCRGFYHAKRLATGGGELLTLVYFLMAHFGIAEQYRVALDEVHHVKATSLLSKLHPNPRPV